MPSSIDMIRRVAEALGPLKDEVVFVGGTAVTLLITDPAAPPIRETKDVDVLVELTGRMKFYELEEQLRRMGFQHGEGPICRWLVDGLMVDIMPTEGKILGFSNQWYPTAFKTAELRDVGNLKIRVISAPLFIATKLDAFHDRGAGDFYGSSDLEDVIAVLSGRKELLEEVQNSGKDVRTYLSKELSKHMVSQAFLNAGPGHLGSDSARWPMVMELIQSIITLGDG